MKLKTHHSNHVKYHTQYHVIMTTKSRKPCITDEMFQCLKEHFEKIARMNDAEIDEISYEPDHIHMLITIAPWKCISNVINVMKSASSRRLHKLFQSQLDQYYDKPMFWNRSYMILSNGSAPADIIQAYIAEQDTDGKRDPGRGNP